MSILFGDKNAFLEKVSLDDIAHQNIVGFGPFGNVYRIQCRAKPEQPCLAVKNYQVTGKSKYEKLLSDYKALESLNNVPHVLSTQAVYSWLEAEYQQEEDEYKVYQMYIVMALAQSSLMTEIKQAIKLQKNFELVKLQSMFKQIVVALHSLAHSRELSHMNIQPSNIL